MAKQKFRTEVSQLLQLIIHSLYSNKEIFLRELISNSSDAIDKLRYLTVSDKKFKGIEFSPRVDIEFNDEDKNKSLTISDNGIGMTLEEVKKYINQVAFSSAEEFLQKYQENQEGIIGHFGLGFY